MPLEVVRGSARLLKNALAGRSLQPVALRRLRLGCDGAPRFVEACPGIHWGSIPDTHTLWIPETGGAFLKIGEHQWFDCDKGAVVISHPLTRLGNGTAFFKIVLQELGHSSSQSCTINALVFGQLAEDCAKVLQQEDIMVVAGFSLAKSASEDDGNGCQLEMSEETGSTIYICPKSVHTAATSETIAMPVAPQYTYTPLNRLKDGTVVNLYGAVKFFKPPYVSKGTDYCLVVTIVDPSHAKLVCNLFHGNRDALPQIYKNGDIVRFHRIKIREFGGQMQGISSSGFSALAFDGTIRAPVVPRTSSKAFTFTDEDKKTVEDLRIWVSSNFSNSAPAAKLSGIQPPMFFELTCQLVGKGKVDGSSYLLKVWDGTKCPFPPWRVFVHEEDLEGDGVLIKRLQNLTVDVVVYDNHVQLARSLKVGSVIRMYSLHAKTQSLEAKPDVSYAQFHLHGGTGYGRGITVLPESHTDARQLKAFLDSVDLAESSEAFSHLEEESTNFTLGTCSERCQQLSVTVLTDHQHFDVTALGTILNSTIPQEYRIRAQLRRFEPRKLHQSIKLHCPQCHVLQEVPDMAELDSVLRQASAAPANPDLRLPFCESIVWGSENLGQRLVTVHFVKHKELLQEPEGSLILIEGATSNEVLRLSKKFKGIIPVSSTEDNLSLLDLSAPFLCQGNIQYYGCKHCSAPKTLENLDSLAAEETPSWELAAVAQALGIAPLQYVFVMKFTLDDGTGTLDTYLMDCKDFFQIPASEVLTNNMLQENMEENMNKLCPPECDVDDLPWLECFIKSYYVKDGTETQLCYWIFDTTIAEDI